MVSRKIDSNKRLVSFVNELKERKVLRVAVAYLVVTWIVIQVGESTFESLNLPIWANGFLVVFCNAWVPIRTADGMGI